MEHIEIVNQSSCKVWDPGENIESRVAAVELLQTCFVIKTWQIRKMLSQRFKHKQLPKRGRKGKRFMMACHNRCK